MKKILITSSIMPPEIGGPAYYVPEIVNRLGNSYHFRVITFTPNPKPLGDIKVFSVSQSGGIIIRQARLFWLILKNALWAEIIFAQDPLVVGLATVLVGKLMGKKTVIKYVGDPAWEEAFGKRITTKFLDQFLADPGEAGLWGRLNIFLTKISFILAKKIITPSKYIASVVTDHYQISKNKVILVYNAIEVPQISAPGRNTEVFKVVTPLGRLVKWKKVDEVIVAVRTVNSRDKIHVKLLVVGDGPEVNNLKALAKGEDVEFLGKKSREEGLKILKFANLFVLNSVYEGLPHTVLEAFAVGTPVVATNISGTNEIAINNQTALTVDPGDTEALAATIQKLLTDDKLARRLTRAAATLLKKQFNWEINTKLLKKVFAGCYTSL